MTEKHTAETRSAAAVKLRALITHLQIMLGIISEAQAEGQVAFEKIMLLEGEELLGEKLRTQLLHCTNLLANAKIAVPGIEELQRRIAKLTEFPAEQITSDFGAQVRTNNHGQYQRSETGHRQLQGAA